MSVQSLNKQFGIAGQLEFVEGPGGLVQARIANNLGKALVSTYAGQVLHFKPRAEEEDLLFVSKSAYFADGKAIKGGAPVCWPWFGPDPEGKGRPAHGFVRNRQWRVTGSAALDDGTTQIELGLDADAGTREIWPHDFQLRIRITVGSELQIELVTTNLGEQPFQLTQALHTYFRIGDIKTTRVLGLQGLEYVDKVDGGARKTQQGQVLIDGEVDRIYQGVEGELEIEDAGFDRHIRIFSSGSRSAVVWNPWAEIAAGMADLGNDDYRRMLCVETTNAGEDVVSVTPGESFTLGVRYSVESA